MRGKLRENLKRHIARGELIGRQGKDLVSIPIPRIDLPRLRLGGGREGGVGQGNGEAGDPTSGKGSSPGEGGAGKAGQDEGEHALEVEMSLDELADILGEELELPRIESKGKATIVDQKDRYVGIRRVGPNSLRHNKRTFRMALKRQIALRDLRSTSTDLDPEPR